VCAYGLREIEPLFEEQPVDPYQIHDRNLVVAVDESQGTHRWRGPIRSACPTPSFPVSPPPKHDAGIAGRQLPHDVRGRISAAGHEVANQHELIVVDARIYEHIADARAQERAAPAGAVAQDDDRELSGP